MQSNFVKGGHLEQFGRPVTDHFPSPQLSVRHELACFISHQFYHYTKIPEHVTSFMTPVTFMAHFITYISSCLFCFAPFPTELCVLLFIPLSDVLNLFIFNICGPGNSVGIATDTLEHRLIVCGEGRTIWQYTKSILARMMRTIPARIPDDWALRLQFNI